MGAPEGLLRVVLASVKPISTIKTALPSFDTLFSLAVIVVVVVVVVVVEYIIILIIIIVGPVDFGELHFCQTVRLESLLFLESSFLRHKVMGRQIRIVVAVLFFLWRAQ